MVLEPPEPPGARMPFEQLLQAGGSFPPVVDIPPDADDETMVELAIALSLQDQSGGAIGLQGLRLASNAQVKILFIIYYICLAVGLLGWVEGILSKITPSLM